jgi:hypothetical protein
MTFLKTYKIKTYYLNNAFYVEKKTRDSRFVLKIHTSNIDDRGRYRKVSEDEYLLFFKAAQVAKVCCLHVLHI